MRLDFALLLRSATLAASIAITPSIGFAQLPNARSSTQAPAPVPTVMRPAEGQVVTGDLGITVQVPPGVRASKYSIEAAYWDAARNTWVYPGLLAPDFAGSTTTIAADVRVKFSPTATRWRVHVHAVDPPGSWGPWREFTWQSAAPASPSANTPEPTVETTTGVPTSSTTAPPTGVPPAQEQQPPAGTAAPPAGGGAAGVMAPQPNPPSVPISENASALVAEIDKQIAQAKKQIVLLNIQIIGLQKQIAALQADITKTADLKAAAYKKGASWKEILALENQIKADQDAIASSADQIESRRKDVKALEELIAKLRKQRAKILADLQVRKKGGN